MSTERVLPITRTVIHESSRPRKTTLTVVPDAARTEARWRRSGFTDTSDRLDPSHVTVIDPPDELKVRVNGASPGSVVGGAVTGDVVVDVLVDVVVELVVVELVVVEVAVVGGRVVEVGLTVVDVASTCVVVVDPVATDDGGPTAIVVVVIPAEDDATTVVVGRPSGATDVEAVGSDAPGAAPVPTVRVVRNGGLSTSPAAPAASVSVSSGPRRAPQSEGAAPVVGTAGASVVAAGSASPPTSIALSRPAVTVSTVTAIAATAATAMTSEERAAGTIVERRYRTVGRDARGRMRPGG